MPTFEDPLSDAAEASQALRGLAFATRSFDQPADTYLVLGELASGLRSLQQVLDQLADAHTAHAGQAFDDNGSSTRGVEHALTAADELHQAAALLDRVDEHFHAGFVRSGQIAWQPAAKSVTVGTLRLTVWPDPPDGEHQRYGYQIADAGSGLEVTGRDLFTGAGQPVDVDRALRELAGFLTAAGEARQYALHHPGSTPDNDGLFPQWVGEAARVHADSLTELAEDGPEPAITDAVPRWVSVVFLQGQDADEVLEVIDRDGPEAGLDLLTGWDYGAETTEAALVSGHVYDDLPAGLMDRQISVGDYTMTYNAPFGYVGLVRQELLPAATVDEQDPAPVDAESVEVVSAQDAISGIGAGGPDRGVRGRPLGPQWQASQASVTSSASRPGLAW